MWSGALRVHEPVSGVPVHEISVQSFQNSFVKEQSLNDAGALIMV